MAREINDQDELRSTLVKLIPTEVIGFYTAAQAVAPPGDPTKPGSVELNVIVLTVIAAICLVGTPFYLRLAQRVRRGSQIAASTVAFVVWIYTLGGPFTAWEGYKHVHLSFQGSGTLALLLFTFITGIIPWKSDAGPPQNQPATGGPAAGAAH